MIHETLQSICHFGVARCDITPPVGIYHRMWGAATHDRATGVHRPLLASAVFFEPLNDSKTGCRVIITLDHCLLGDAEIQLLRSTITRLGQIADEQLMITFTHTHGAGLMSLDRAGLPGGELIEPYLCEVAQCCGRLVAEAKANACEATVAYGVGRCSLAANRDFYDAERKEFVCGFNPDAAVDDTVVIARVTDEQGQTVATFVNYACHPTTLAWDNQLISPDYIGALRETVERDTSAAPCIFLQGASAELGPREGFVGNVEVADRNGRQLAYAVLEALTALPPPRTSYRYQGATISGATLGTWKYEPMNESRAQRVSFAACLSQSLKLQYRADRPSRSDVEKTLATQQQIERDALSAGKTEQARDARAMMERQTRMLRRMDELPKEHYPYLIQGLRLGDAIWLGVPGELYSELQTSLRRQFPNNAIIVITLVDGWGPSYIVPQEIYGQGLYQESVAVLAPGTFEQIVDAAGTLIASLMEPAS